METFPTEYKQALKEKLVVIKKHLTGLDEAMRSMKNQMVKDFNNAWLYEYAMKRANETREQGLAEQRRIEWLLKPVKGDGALNIAQAKATPIPQIIEINRKTGLCPWHEDKHPSLTYYPQNNTVWCFVCNRGGDSIDVASKLWGLSFKETVLKLTT